MLNHVDHLSSRLAAPLTSTMTSVRLRDVYDTRSRLNKLPVGDHIYLIVSYQGRQEVVKYTHTQELTSDKGDIVLPVERAQHGTVRTSWPTGTCVRTEYTFSVAKEQLNEWWEAKNCNCGDAR